MRNPLTNGSMHRGSGEPHVRVERPSRVAAARGVRAAMSLLLFAAIAATVPLASPADQRAVNRADALLSTAETGTNVLNFLHMGADYHGHRYLKTLPVSDGRGDFELVYRYFWHDDGITDLGFLCDDNGFVYKVRVEYTNAVWSQPFLAANVSISVLGHSMIEAYKDKLSEDDRRKLHELVNKADAKGLLELSLAWNQVFR